MSTGSLELWGGYECTINRIHDHWHDQTPRSGHDARIADLGLFSDLGLKSLRYPVLWESVSPEHPDRRDFARADERLAEIRRLGMNPIVTLCHHGSGPHWTSLVDDGFAPGLAAHAAAVAARYPWVRDWTPVNEPLTTARFSALYGYWYPHTRDEGLFWTALLNEIDATRASMQAIRAINPAARLIQTDDLGYCHATAPLRSEAAFQNERRWIGWDLLCGMVVPGHALWDRIAGFGLGDRLRAIADDPSPPDVIGINHYLASERLLDHRLERHGDRAVADRELGSCDGVTFVDVDAVRTRPEGTLGLPELLRQAWQRYGRTISITECHNGGTREEQLRWFVEVWDAARALRDDGVDICAVTAWSLLGSYDWHRMVTRFIGHYEPGVFDVRGGAPRETALAPVLRGLAAGERPTGPWAGTPGWWRRESRFGADPFATDFELAIGEAGPAGERPLLILGENGTLTDLAIRACETRGLHYCLLWPDERDALDLIDPWAVFDTADRDGLCGARFRAAAEIDRRMAERCARRGLTLARIGGPERVHDDLPSLLAVSTDPIYAPWDDCAPAVALLDRLDNGEPARWVAGARWRWSYGPDLVDAVLDLLLDAVSGPVELRARPVDATAFARVIAEVAEADPSLLKLCPGAVAGEAVSDQALLPPPESTAERFVRERRFWRALERDGVNDLAMLQAAE